jgi:integrase
MTDTTTPTAAPRARTGGVILTDRMCEKRVATRTKIYDRKCPGLYVSITTVGVATFSAKITDPETGKQVTAWLGLYNPETFTVEHARAKVYGLKARGGTAVAETLRQRKTEQAKQGKTVAEAIEERIDWMATPVRKPDGELRPRLESYEHTACFLRRFVGVRLGNKLMTEVTNHDIATLSNDIVAGKFGKPSTSNARHMRKAASSLFKWAAEAGRDYVSANPCVNLPKLDAEHPRTRVLSTDEIRTFWHGLDRDDLPCDRITKLALKFALVTMLRSNELRGARRDELFLEDKNPRFDVPLKRVKKRRVIQQPLSDLACEIIRAAMQDGVEHIFADPTGDIALNKWAMATALRGPRKGNGKKGNLPGICALLGLKPFTPHDLRRTAATLAGDLGFDDAVIAKCLDHAASRQGDVIVPTVTGKVYSLSKRMVEKRAVLDAVAKALRRIIGEPAVKAELQLAA